MLQAADINTLPPEPDNELTNNPEAGPNHSQADLSSILDGLAAKKSVPNHSQADWSGAFDEISAADWSEALGEKEENETLTSRLRQASKRLKGLYLGVVARSQSSIHDGFGKLQEYFTDQEQGDRRKIIAGAAGVLALAAAGYATYRFGFSGNSSSSHTHEITEYVPNKPMNVSDAPVTEATKHLSHDLPPHKPVKVNASPVAKALQHPNQLTGVEHLTSRDTIWHEAQERLVRNGDLHPSNAQIWAFTQHILNINHLTWEKAKDLPVGYSFKV